MATISEISRRAFFLVATPIFGLATVALGIVLLPVAIPLAFLLAGAAAVAAAVHVVRNAHMTF